MDTFKLDVEKLLDRKSLHIKIPPADQHKALTSMSVNYIESHSIKRPNFNIYFFNIIIKYKTYIDQPEISAKWNKLKLFTNLYELVSYNNPYKHIQSLIDYVPLSRAYFKFQELIVQYDLIDKSQKNIRYAAQKT